MIAANSGYVPANKGHTAGEKGAYIRYSVYDNRTDMPIIIDGTAAECAKALNRSKNCFYCMVNRVSKGTNKRYSVMKRMLDAPEEDEILS